MNCDQNGNRVSKYDKSCHICNMRLKRHLQWMCNSIPIFIFSPINQMSHQATMPTRPFHIYLITHLIYVTERRSNFGIQDCFALNCNLKYCRISHEMKRTLRVNNRLYFDVEFQSSIKLFLINMCCFIIFVSKLRSNQYQEQHLVKYNAIGQIFFNETKSYYQCLKMLLKRSVRLDIERACD